MTFIMDFRQGMKFGDCVSPMSQKSTGKIRSRADFISDCREPDAECETG